MSKKNTTGNISGKGYYIALILCAVAIGISGYLYYRNAGDTNLQDPSVAVDATTPDNDVVAVATPGSDADNTTQPQPTGDGQKPAKTTSPVSGETVLGYSMDALSYNQTTRDWRVHNGIDIAAEEGTEVCAAADGEVYAVFEDELLGTTVVIRHEDDYTTRYSSLHGETKVTPGEKVRAGQVIGAVGKSAMMEYAIGDHVHFSVSKNGDAVDPEEFLAQN